MNRRDADTADAKSDSISERSTPQPLTYNAHTAPTSADTYNAAVTTTAQWSQTFAAAASGGGSGGGTSSNGVQIVGVPSYYIASAFTPSSASVEPTSAIPVQSVSQSLFEPIPELPDTSAIWAAIEQRFAPVLDETTAQRQIRQKQRKRERENQRRRERRAEQRRNRDIESRQKMIAQSIQQKQSGAANRIVPMQQLTAQQMPTLLSTVTQPPTQPPQPQQQQSQPQPSTVSQQQAAQQQSLLITAIYPFLAQSAQQTQAAPLPQQTPTQSQPMFHQFMNHSLPQSHSDALMTLPGIAQSLPLSSISMISPSTHSMPQTNSSRLPPTPNTPTNRTQLPRPIAINPARQLQSYLSTASPSSSPIFTSAIATPLSLAMMNGIAQSTTTQMEVQPQSATLTSSQAPSRHSSIVDSMQISTVVAAQTSPTISTGTSTFAP